MDEEVEQGLIALQAQADAVTALQDKILHDLQAASDGELSCTDHSTPNNSHFALGKRATMTISSAAAARNVDPIGEAVVVIGRRAKRHQRLLHMCISLEKRCERAEERLTKLQKSSEVQAEVKSP